MENASPFTQAKLGLLVETAPPINLDQSWQRFQQARRRTRVERTLLGIAASFLAAISLLPQPRAWAQQAWTTYVLGHTNSIALDFAKNSPTLLLPNVFPLYPAFATKPLRTASHTEAAAAAGFPIKLLSSQSGAKTFLVLQPPTLERTLEKSAIDAELKRLQRDSIAWPQSLDGATVKLSQGKNAITHYGTCPTIAGPWNSCAFLVQYRAPQLHLSVPIALAAFTAFSLELAGLSRTRAQSLAKLESTFFLPFETNNCTLQSAKVHRSPATLILYPKAPNGEEAYNLQWQEQGFHFSLFGRGPSRAVSLAESLR
jgi:hypothetical protein